jgi:pimeloyl-ACP methyl ester carboxylesterase
MATSWQLSLDRVASLMAADDDRIAPACKTQFLSHGTATPCVHVLLHGYTNSPAQFREIAQAYFDAGDNVLVPRVPFHGYADPLTRELSELTPEVLEAFCNEIAAAAAGLGERLVVTGLSLGGMLAGYLAKMRDEVSEARLVAPFIQPNAVPEWVNAPFDAALRALPDVYSWWNPKLHEKEVAGTWATPKFSLKAVAAQIATRRRLERATSPRTTRLERVLLVVNDNDIAVRNDIAERFVAEQLEPLSLAVEVVKLDKALGFTHDVFEANGDNHDRMDSVRDEVWPLLGLAAPAHGALDAPTPGGGYYPELGRWAGRS